MRHANDVILLVDSRMRIVDANDRVRAVYGRSAEATKGLHLLELRAPSTHGALDPDFERVFARGGLVFETLHRRADGSEFPVEVSSRPVDIVKRMVELLGGTVAVEDGTHGGSRCTVTLPCEISTQP